MEFSALVARAAEMAAVWHEGQTRRDPHQKVPYIVHPFSVGLLLTRAGLDEEIVAAGLLHDVIEDSGVTEKEIAKLFGRRVAKLVTEVTEPGNLREWKARKTAFLARLSKASPDALAIKCADHIDNLQSLLRIADNGDDPWVLFFADKGEKVWYETSMYGLVKGRVPEELEALHASSIEELLHLVEVSA